MEVVIDETQKKNLHRWHAPDTYKCLILGHQHQN